MRLSKRLLMPGAVALLSIVGVAGWLATRSGSGTADKPDTPFAVATQKVTPKTLQPATSDTETFRFVRTTTQESGPAPEACLVFNKPLDETGHVKYEDYVRLQPEAQVASRVERQKLCLAGLNFGGAYKVTLRPGLPAAGQGGKLEEEQQVAVTFGDREPVVALGQGFILPRETSDGLPITTVNVDRLAVKLYRVGDRILARMRTDLLDQRSFYPYSIGEIGGDQGRLVWQGEVPVTGTRNASATTLFPLTDAIGKTEPGVYLLTALSADAGSQSGDSDGYDRSYRAAAGQWVVQSDMGLTDFWGSDGLTLSVRSLSSAKPLGGVRLSLIARNNEILAEAKSDSDGLFHFSAGLTRGTGGSAPVMVMAYRDDGDFNFLDLRRSGFDLSDRGVEGRQPSGPVDAFLYADRGIYRPGETVELTVLLRDQRASALPGRRLTLKLLRPDGKEFRQYELADAGGGAGHLSAILPASASRGAWRADVYADPDLPAIGTLSFQVQDFVPQRLEVTIKDKPARLAPGDDLNLALNARFLYGAPGAMLSGEGQMVLEPDPTPFPAYKGYYWGVRDTRIDAAPVNLHVDDTDAQGDTRVTGTVPGNLSLNQYARANIHVAVREPGGRTTDERVVIPVSRAPFAIGIRPQFQYSAPNNGKAGFEVIAVGPDGKPIAAKKLKWQLVKYDLSWDWYDSGRGWRYQRSTHPKVVASGVLDVGTDKPTVLSTPVRWGEYYVAISDDATDVLTEYGFYAGWYGEQGVDRPDRLKLATDKTGYAAGDTARLHIDSDVAGEALLVIANEGVHMTRNITVAAGGTDISVKVGADWGPGAYALVTLYRPLKTVVGHTPVRAVGVAWLGLDAARRTLDVAIGAPEKVLPRQTLTVPITVKGAERKAYVTLTAVDQGILQLTHFTTPKPQDYFLGKRRLGISMRDDYSRLIRAEAQRDDQGGDSFGGASLEIVPTRTVALFSGIVTLDGAGKADIPLVIPDFQGELRLMAVAWDAEKLGSAEQRLTVHDPVVTELILPRFLAPSDKARATVLLHNVEGVGGTYRVAVTAKGAAGGGQAEQTVDLAAGERRIFTVPLDGTAAGIGTVTLSVAGPGGFQVQRSWPIQVRPPQLPVTREMTTILAAGENVTLPADLTKDMIAGTESVTLSVSRWQGVDVAGALRWLDRYPFGCLEQTVSRAMPLLWFNDLAVLTGGQQDKSVPDRIQDNVDRVLTMQDPEGGFHMWGPYGELAHPWVSVFAVDFLEQALEQGYVVPAEALRLARQWLVTATGRNYAPVVRAYASWVLARKGNANVSDLRYFHDHALPGEALAAAQLGAALDAVGEKGRAAQAFDVSRQALGTWAAQAANDEAEWRQAMLTGRFAQIPVRTDIFGSRLRDTYAIATMMAMSGRSVAIPDLLNTAQLLDQRVEATSTQEKAWMLRAASTLAAKGSKLAVTLDGNALGSGDPASASVPVGKLKTGVSLINRGETPLYRRLSIEGVPTEPEPASAVGVDVRKDLYSTDGKLLDPAQVKQNDRVVVVITGNAAPGSVEGQYAILDLLPAGLEVEGVIKPGQPGYSWLDGLSNSNIAEGRDDRFVAAVTLPADRSYDDGGRFREAIKNLAWRFRVAYVARAVTPGSFALPGVVAEHMYVPQVKARAELGRIEVAQ